MQSSSQIHGDDTQMKMPWSFLTRRRTAEPSPTEIAEAKAAFDPGGVSSDLLEQPPAAVPSPVAPTDTAANFEDTSKSLVPAQGRREGAEHAVAEKAEVQSSPPASSRRSRPATREQRGLVAVPARDSSAPLPKADMRVVKSSVPEPTPNENFVIHASILDMEIEHLRRELAEKLKLQNAQLREMLQRFDPS